MKYLDNWRNKNYFGTYIFSSLTLVYLSATFIIGCDLYRNEGQRPIPVKSIPIRGRNDKSLPIRRLEPKTIEQLPAPIEKPKQPENKPVPQRPVPRDEPLEEDAVEPAFARNDSRLEYRLG